MKVIAINASARRDGNTAILLRHVLNELEVADIDTELVQLGGSAVRGCKACYTCVREKNQRCVIESDPINGLIEKMLAADGIILGSPTYFANVTAEMKALIDRAGMVAKANGDMLRRKVGAAVVAVRRAGSIHVFNSINHFFFISQMIVPGSCYWNLGQGREKGDVESDAEGLRTMKVLGENMAWLLRRVHGENG